MPMCADTCTNKDTDARFRQALDRVVRLEERERHGIGMQKEKTLHAVLKAYEVPDEDHHEIPIENYIADIYCEETGTITEIQTANMGYLRQKLDVFLPLYHVRVVYPIPAVKWVTWIDPETGELGKRSRSPKIGSFYSAFRELYKISSYLDHPNLSIKLILLDMEEYRLKDGWGRDGKRGSHRYDRVPTRIVGETLLTEPRDYMQFIPYELDEPFTAGELAKSCGLRVKSFSTEALILRKMGVIEQVGKRGRSYLYRVANGNGRY